MPNTSLPAKRRLLHQRRVECHGYERDDNLWDIEAQMVDTKTTSFPSRYRKQINAGEPIHNMKVRIAIDIHFVIHEIDVQMIDTPYKLCPQIASTYQQVVGLKIAKGFNRKIKELFGGVRGCAHVTELWGIIATVAYQTTFQAQMEANGETTSSALAGACHVHSNEERVQENVAHIQAK